MTIKQVYPEMPIEHRLSFGKNVISCFKELHHSVPPKIEEDGFQVCDYPDQFIKDRFPLLIKRYKKKYPEVIKDIPPPVITPVPEKKKRKRIQVSRVSK